MEDLPLSDWEQVLNVNLTGYFITSQRFGREMIKAGQGRLVHISTVASHSPETFSGVYSSTKAGVNMMSSPPSGAPTASAPTASSPASLRPRCRPTSTPTPRSKRAAAV